MLKAVVRSCLRAAGFELRRIHQDPGPDPLAYVRRVLARTPKPVILDIGANVGQSLTTFLAYWPGATIHAFEPARSAFAALQRNTSGTRGVVLNHCAVGAAAGSQPFFENSEIVMSSVLETGHEGWGEIVARYEVPTTTVDQYLDGHGIDRVHLLKIDTQGSDLSVLAGAAASLDHHRLVFVFAELNFAELYRGQCRADEVLRFMHDRGMPLVGLYDFHYRGDRAGWADGLFVDPRAEY